MCASRSTTREVLILAGTRPEGVKTAPLIRRLLDDPRFTVRVADTGQQPGRVAEALDPFDLRPEVSLRPQRRTGSLAELAAALITGIDDLLTHHRPAAVVVQGDTTTALAGGTAAFWRRVPIVHLEAGLRTNDLDRPFPEEANRAMLARIAALHLAPTEAARVNLLGEGIPASAIAVTGNTVVDALADLVDRGVARPPDWIDPARRLVVATAHRREHWGHGVAATIDGLRRLARRRPDLQIVMVAHPNPRLSAEVTAGLAGVANARVTPPLAYPQMVGLLRVADLVVTDSGGLQEEAATLGVPLLVTRDTTERPEALAAGRGELVGTDPERLLSGALRRLATGRGSAVGSPFGDGRAAHRCVTAMAGLLGVPTPRITQRHRTAAAVP
ncbi:UDP-N-acetylglucosamine 2-epimerase (non-hydrolyzing) [Micromonospora sp. WMMD1120]|uniref:non-hydrolyzing UDP-N-acetylglucosamine 2-epimerase n=1 Tax=Micromonospora sp. WMMD1120 TaxID=3016106 RepID=UPI00241801FE|nr:UDP-N-acetylglucosamine 2-epimerase (non-hydrolyzing) [Micromonospora sp. WMMD1120]MDG4810502.1 UDP-N-acetylglucosamine 2-epimerase (non-hydrolyzing) [Micromonospora sp. WMMD1120]